MDIFFDAAELFHRISKEDVPRGYFDPFSNPFRPLHHFPANEHHQKNPPLHATRWPDIKKEKRKKNS